MAQLLVVDDDGHIREVMRFTLEKAGHQVTEAQDGAEAYGVFRSRSFDRFASSTKATRVRSTPRSHRC